MTTILKNGWSEGDATEDGTYLRAFDEWDEDEDGDEFQLIGGKWHKDGIPWMCYGGVWKRTSDLPNSPSDAEDDGSDVRESEICICQKPKEKGQTVCWNCFKYRTDVEPFKDFQGSYEQWVATLPPVP